MNELLVDSPFRQDILKGLSANPKYLLPKYFYDARGDELFQQIMHCPEYYLTQAEAEILSLQSRRILERCANTSGQFDIVELGAGDGSKTIFLLQEALRMQCSQQYYPIDISPSMIAYLNQNLGAKLPGMQVSGLAGDYFDMLEQLQTANDQPKLVLFLGATVGNMLPREAVQFFQQLKSFLRQGDHVLVGFDLKKNPQTILDAYNDKGGLTKAFNLNLLQRINRELGANFQLHQFSHFPVYDPITGSCKSYLISTCDQRVTFDDDTVIAFERDEPIYMEVSQKYSKTEIQQLASQAGFKPVESFYDSRHQFADVLWRVSSE
ncbi:L-histidine N(alpha)-methyltransferase [Spirosoma validum]|uniref:L-histidine N(Alpha)-methyltransferase n=1 Tax=Spirosoma validum TaxID=2771355 RepID=A0A927B7I5_9BACT|nr:L-histidine N(alpha)-methyltransferase [Spirosoma validum]MBD2756708.1 L-histidine N(alpha)-methyltransferase [Spirosoma validum]